MTDTPVSAPRTLDNVRGGAQLLRRARQRHPTCAWWWGRRTLNAIGHAYCYVCDDVIAQWYGRTPLPDDVAAAIDHHRQTHLTEARAESPTTKESA
jgi:hypothetical protein